MGFKKPFSRSDKCNVHNGKQFFFGKNLGTLTYINVRTIGGRRWGMVGWPGETAAHITTVFDDFRHMNFTDFSQCKNALFCSTTPSTTICLSDWQSCRGGGMPGPIFAGIQTFFLFSFPGDSFSLISFLSRLEL